MKANELRDGFSVKLPFAPLSIGRKKPHPASKTLKTDTRTLGGLEPGTEEGGHSGLTLSEAANLGHLLRGLREQEIQNKKLKELKQWLRNDRGDEESIKSA